MAKLFTITLLSALLLSAVPAVAAEQKTPSLPEKPAATKALKDHGGISSIDRSSHDGDDSESCSYTIAGSDKDELKKAMADLDRTFNIEMPKVISDMKREEAVRIRSVCLSSGGDPAFCQDITRKPEDPQDVRPDE